MTVLRFVLFAVLAQLSNCAGLVCGIVPGREFDIQVLRVQGVADTVAPLSNDENAVVLDSTRGPNARDVVVGGKVFEIPPMRFVVDQRPAIISDGGWWFSRTGWDERGLAVYFAGNERNTRVGIERAEPLLWLALRGEEPRGVLVSVADSQPALHLDVVTSSGITQTQAFLWWQQASDMHRTLTSGLWSAEALEGTGIAVVAIDGPEGSEALTLRVIDGDQSRQTVIRCPIAIDSSLATARDGASRIAIVGRSKNGEVVATIVDVNQPQNSRCRAISSPGEAAIIPEWVPSGSLDTIWTGTNFVAAWVRDDGAVRACELGALNYSPLVVDVGDGADIRRPLRQMLHARDERVTIVWRQTTGDIALRRMPSNMTGFLFGREVANRICALPWFADSKAQ
jgi:hypothetical protein